MCLFVLKYFAKMPENKRGRGGKKTRGVGKKGGSSRAKSGTTEILEPQPEMTAQDERQGETVIPHA